MSPKVVIGDSPLNAAEAVIWPVPPWLIGNVGMVSVVLAKFSVPLAPVNPAAIWLDVAMLGTPVVVVL